MARSSGDPCYVSGWRAVGAYPNHRARTGQRLRACCYLSTSTLRRGCDSVVRMVPATGSRMDAGAPAGLPEDAAWVVVAGRSVSSREVVVEGVCAMTLPEVPEMGEVVANVGEFLLENPAADVLAAPVLGAGIAGGLLGTAANEATGHGLSKVYDEAVLDGLLGNPLHGDLSSVPTPEGQTDHPNGMPGHWAHDSNTPDVDATFIQDGEY
jgi:hypothetical protein